MSHVQHSYSEAFEAFLAQYQGNGSRLDRLETLIAKSAWDAAIVAHMRLAGPSGGNLPSGWLAVPVRATVHMHNAAVAGMDWTPPIIEVGEDRVLRLSHSVPDWSLAWRFMIEASPQVPPTATTGGNK